MGLEDIGTMALIICLNGPSITNIIVLINIILSTFLVFMKYTYYNIEHRITEYRI